MFSFLLLLVLLSQASMAKCRRQANAATVRRLAAQSTRSCTMGTPSAFSYNTAHIAQHAVSTSTQCLDLCRANSMCECFISTTDTCYLYHDAARFCPEGLSTAQWNGGTCQSSQQPTEAPSVVVSIVRLVFINDNARCDAFRVNGAVDYPKLDADTQSLADDLNFTFFHTEWGFGPIEIKLSETRNLCNRMDFSLNTNTRLQQLETYLVDEPHAYDMTVLIGQAEDGGGLAYVGGLCKGKSLAVSMQRLRGTITHEMGHVFGLNHVSCGGDVMGSDDTYRFGCSIADMQNVYSSGGLNCLTTRSFVCNPPAGDTQTTNPVCVRFAASGSTFNADVLRNGGMSWLSHRDPRRVWWDCERWRMDTLKCLDASQPVMPYDCVSWEGTSIFGIPLPMSVTSGSC